MLNLKKFLIKLVTISNTVTLQALGKDWTFRKIGPLVFMDAPADSTGIIAGYNAIGTLPEGMRPISVVKVFSGNLFNINCSITINTSGSVVLYSASASAAARNCAFAVSYIAASM